MDSTNEEEQKKNKDTAGKSRAERIRIWKGCVLLLLLSEAIKHLYIASLSASPSYSEDFEEEASEKSDEELQEKVNINF